MKNLLVELRNILLAIRDGVNDLKMAVCLFIVLRKEVLTIEEASLFTGYKVSYLYKLNSQGDADLPVYTPVEGGKLYFKKKELEDWMLSHKKKTVKDVELEMNQYLLPSVN